MNDITYCCNTECPFTDCEKHSISLKGKNGLASFAALDGCCRRYISWLAERIAEGKEP